MTFNPNEHMTDIKGKKYLDVKWRIVWFREAQPDGRIETDVYMVGETMVAKAAVLNAEGNIIATGMATVRAASPSALLMARVSMLSLSTVDVPWALM